MTERGRPAGGGIDVRKSDGQREAYSREKLRRSLRRAGAGKAMAEEIIADLEPQLRDGITTGKLYRMARKALQRRSRRSAITYSLKRALLDLGPSGFPFEQFCGRLFEAMGYQVHYNRFVQGRCVQHEIDIIAERNGTRLFAECKFHNRATHRNDVKLPLYLRARSLDLMSGDAGAHDAFWVLSNTTYSEDALAYADCEGLILAGHNTDHYPLTRGLINQHGLHPLTCLNSLKVAQKRSLIESGAVLCRDLLDQPRLLEPLRLEARQRERVRGECRDILDRGKARRESA
ncbi:ATP cone domain-containing protein [Thioalkalivibrio paradoxus]|uniref:ATP cone domain-containing protein n=1 Tax=Thioalkalivibrio paradoxus TaxID=108010 RepID=UPI00059B80B0|nr:ATP cone domain-containing protein [Thioalkalivibrio paradoxus]